MKKIVVAGLLVCFLLLTIGCSKTETSAQGGQAAVAADKYPERPITIMVAQAAGGASEAGARVWQVAVEKELGVPLNFEFYPGANGQIGLTRLFNAEPDGYTFGVSNAIAVSNSIILQDPEYTMESFDFIVNFARDPGILMAHKDEPYNNLSELVAYAKTQPPESLTVGVPAINDVNVIGLRQFEEATGIKFNIVSFNGGGKARTALVGRQIPMGAFMYYGSTTVKEDTKILGVNVADITVDILKGKQTYNEVAGKVLDDIFSISQVIAPGGFKTQHPERYQFVIDAFKRAYTSPEFLATLEKMEQVQWLNPIYGDDNIEFNKQLWEFCSRTAHYISGTGN